MTLQKTIFFHLATLALIVSVTFFNSLHASFKMDDHDFFNDPKVTNSSLLAYNWVPEPNRHLGIAKAAEESGYRPVTNTILAVLFHIFGQHVEAYHAVMIVLFFTAGAMLYWFVLLLTGQSILAFLTAVLFVVHPVNGLAVNYVVASAYTYQMILAMLCMSLFIRSYQSRYSILELTASIICFLVSLGTHETSIIIPAFLVFIAYYTKKEPWSKNCLKLIPFFLVAVGYVLFRMTHASLNSGVLQKYFDFKMSIVEYLASFTKLVSWYLGQLILPDSIVLMWSTKVVREGCWVWTILGLLLLSAGLWLVVKFRRSLAAFALLVFMIGFLPVMAACLFRPSTGLVIEPHWMYLSSIGFFILTAIFLMRLINANAWAGVLLCAGLVVTLMRLSHVYNDIWSDEKTYGYYWIERAPAFKTTHFYVAYSFMADRRFNEARKFLLDAREGIFSDWQIYTNLGIMDFEEGHYESAVANYQKALAYNPSSMEVYNNLAVIYENQGRIAEAMQANERALSLNRFSIEPRLNLARLTLAQGNKEKAIALYKENLTMVPYEERTLSEYLKLLADSGDQDEIKAMVKDLLANCQDVHVLTDIATVAAQKNILLPALDLYMQVLRIDPSYEPVYVQAGILLANLNELDRAIKLWKQAREIDPGDQEALRLIKHAESVRQQQTKPAK